MSQEKFILILDAQGGGLGAQLVKKLLPVLPQDYRLRCVGTNVSATAAMMKAGAQQGATGENAVIFNAAHAQLIIAPIGMILANGILGEVSPAMAAAVSGANAKKILIPSNSCGVAVAGSEECSLPQAIESAIALVRKELKTLE